MSDQLQQLPTKPPKTPEEIARKKEKKALKKAKKEQEKNVKDDRVYLAFERTLLAWVRTGTNLLTFGFAIIKLLQAEASNPGKHPLLEAVSPRGVGMIMIFAGFFGLLLAVINFSKHAKAMGRTSRETYANPAMLVAYVIMLLCFLILIAPLVYLMANS
jgi:putative membrane protein